MAIARQLISLLLVFALLAFTLRKFGRSRGSFLARLKNLPMKSTRSLEQLERLALTPQHTLHVVRIDAREVVLATHVRGCTLLCELEVAPGSFQKTAAGGPAA